MKKWVGLTLAIYTVLMLAGCGQRGALYLPEQPANTVASAS